MAQQRRSTTRLGVSIAIALATLAGFAALGWTGAVMYYGLATKLNQVSNSLQIQDQATDIVRLRERVKQQDTTIAALSQRPDDKDWSTTSRSWLLMWSGLMKHGSACKSFCEQSQASLDRFHKELSAHPSDVSAEAIKELLAHSGKMAIAFQDMSQQLVVTSTTSASMMAGAGVMGRTPYKGKMYFVFLKNPMVGAEILSGEVTDFVAEAGPSAK